MISNCYNAVWTLHQYNINDCLYLKNIYHKLKKRTKLCMRENTCLPHVLTFSYAENLIQPSKPHITTADWDHCVLPDLLHAINCFTHIHSLTLKLKLKNQNIVKCHDYSYLIRGDIKLFARLSKKNFFKVITYLINYHWFLLINVAAKFGKFMYLFISFTLQLQGKRLPYKCYKSLNRAHSITLTISPY